MSCGRKRAELIGPTVTFQISQTAVKCMNAALTGDNGVLKKDFFAPSKRCLMKCM